jgi:nucleoid DNA-binding protein
MAAKIQIPDELKKDLVQSKWGKILIATPIIMTVIATALAGLASSEMTRAQYDRSYAAQLQSKAGDQWSYYQAKKLRGALAADNLDMLMATSVVLPLDAPALPNADDVTVAALTKGEIPDASPAKFDDNINVALKAVANSASETEIDTDLAHVTVAQLASALAAAQQAASDFDDRTKTINQIVDSLDKKLRNGDQTVFRNFSAARLRYTQARYDAESKLNMSVANIFELQVREYNISAERHHRRSTKFFYGMLTAQMAVIIATFSIASQKRSFLWSLAAAAGLAAVSFSVYVYLCF